jgi:hypothetical protein
MSGNLLRKTWPTGRVLAGYQQKVQPACNKLGVLDLLIHSGMCTCLNGNEMLEIGGGDLIWSHNEESVSWNLVWRYLALSGTCSWLIDGNFLKIGRGR